MHVFACLKLFFACSSKVLVRNAFFFCFVFVSTFVNYWMLTVVACYFESWLLWLLLLLLLSLPMLLSIIVDSVVNCCLILFCLFFCFCCLFAVCCFSWCSRSLCCSCSGCCCLFFCCSCYFCSCSCCSWRLWWYCCLLFVSGLLSSILCPLRIGANPFQHLSPWEYHVWLGRGTTTTNTTMTRTIIYNTNGNDNNINNDNNN